MMDWIGRVIEVKKNSFMTDTGREFEFPFDIEGVSADSLNEWLDYLIGQLKERRARK